MLSIDNAKCDDLAARGVAGDAAASQALVEYLWPVWLELIRSSRAMKSLPYLDDAVHDVVARLVEKLGQPNGRGLELYLIWKERNHDKAFEDWLRIVTANAIRDYVREKVGTRRVKRDDSSVKRLLNEFAVASTLDDLGVRPPLTLAQTARELLEFASTRLSERPLTVLKAWMQGASFEDIGVEYGLSADEARNQLRAAVAVLRRHFGEDEL